MKRISLAESICRVAISLGLLILVPGCSLFAPKTEDVTIDSEPTGASVIIPGKARLTTPATVNLPCDKDVTIVVQKEGYYPQTYSIHPTLGKCGILDVVGTLLVLFPAVGLISSGAYTLNQHTVYAPLVEKETKKATP